MKNRQLSGLKINEKAALQVAGIDWSPDQKHAIKRVVSWFRTSNADQVFYLYGFAGTGKSTLIAHLGSIVQGVVAYAAFTGKAASIMRSKGCVGASTVHSLIYKPVVVDKKVEFRLDHSGAASKASLIVIDEASMIDSKMGQDLLSFGKKVLVVGDPFQLPPVREQDSFFIKSKPDYLLTQVHRQALKSSVLWLATRVREGHSLSIGKYGKSYVSNHADFNPKYLIKADQVICGTNKTRNTYNVEMRQALGYKSELPMRGDKIICLRNNNQLAIFNGEMFKVDKFKPVSSEVVQLDLFRDGSTKNPIRLQASCKPFKGEKFEAMWGSSVNWFDYGYAITCHKSQGSSWNNVVIDDESWVFRDSRERWLYTAITRAVRSVVILR